MRHLNCYSHCCGEQKLSIFRLHCKPSTLPRFRTIVKTKAFYQQHADRNQKYRAYFYNVDIQGRLFLEETLPKNVATSIKDDRFLNFFFRRLRPNDIAKSLAADYPYVSVCTPREINFIRPAVCPIVFHTLEIEERSSTKATLYHAGSLATPFSPTCLAVSPQSGCLYHATTTSMGGDYGLVRSNVAVQLTESLSCDEVTGRWMYNDPRNEGKESIVIPWLPIECEPGQWGMPLQEPAM